MNPLTDTGTRKTLKTIWQALDRGLPLLEAKKRVRAQIDSIPWLNRYGKKQVREQAYQVLRRMSPMPKESLPLLLSSPKNFDPIMQAFNRSLRDMWAKTKKSYIDSKMRMGRQNEEPRIFYLVSSHQNPAERHRKYQGTVLVDRYWRKALKDAKMDDMVDKVEAVIRNRGIITVQKAMGAPDYLIMRPNCRHHLVALRTKTVLTKSPKSIAKMFPEASHGGGRSKSKATLRREYKASRRKLYLSCMGKAKRKTLA